MCLKAAVVIRTLQSVIGQSFSQHGVQLRASFQFVPVMKHTEWAWLGVSLGTQHGIVKMSLSLLYVQSQCIDYKSIYLLNYSSHVSRCRQSLSCDGSPMRFCFQFRLQAVVPIGKGIMVVSCKKSRK